MKIIATALTTVETKNIFPFLKKYTAEESVEKILVGAPLNLNDTETDATPIVQQFVKRLKKELPVIPVEMFDERYTSKLAVRAMIDMGMKKKERRKKENIDQIAATIMLQEYLQRFDF